MSKEKKELADIAEFACDRVKKAGGQARVSVGLSRSFRLKLRDGKKEEVKASVGRGLSIKVYVNGRYGSHSTSQLSRKEVSAFIDDAVEMTGLLMKDQHRALADPELYKARSSQSLSIYDPVQAAVTMAQREERARSIYEAARAVAKDKLISAGSGAADKYSHSVLHTTNGFVDQEERTSFWQWATVSVKDPSGRRPSDWSNKGGRQAVALGAPEAVGREAAERAVATIGAKAIPSFTLPVVVENRAVRRLLGGLLRPLSGFAIDQGRSCFAKSRNQRVTAELFSIIDDPAVLAGLGSRRYDQEGITARRFPLVEAGTLRNFYVDSYYGRKLKEKPTTGRASNLVFSKGKHSLQELCRRADKVLFITDFLGGNSNSTTGDFSHGINGFLLEGGKRVRPVSSMNIAGNHRDFWQRLVAVGSDPYLYAKQRTPSLMFSKTLVSGI